MLCANGLVDILNVDNNQDISNKFRLIDKIPVKSISTICSPEIGNIETSILSKAFFSKQNINIIQNAIIKGVYDETKHIIDKQEPSQLLTAMKRIYMERCGEFIDVNVSKPILSDREKIISLNDKVISICIHSIKNELISYLKYREEISTMAIPQDLPILLNTKNKTLELKPWF